MSSGGRRTFAAALLAVFTCAVARADDDLDARLYEEYGAVLAADGVTRPPRGMFSSEEEVVQFQASLQISGGEYRLQSAAAAALEAARADAAKEGLTISPSAPDAAARDYSHTVDLWRSRVEPALAHWIGAGRLSEDEADRLRALEPREQTAAILRLESEGLFFAPGFARSILSSVAPPGASQHLALLALDVKEHRNARVRRILERHGWYQTVLGDSPHFTYLGVPRTRIESLGLAMARAGGREYWRPRASTESKVVFGRSVEGRPLVAYVFGEGANVTMIFGGFHNNEPAAAMVVEELRVHLARHPEASRGRTVVVVPQTNPDGSRPGTRANAHGVDLNRNFPGTWDSVMVAARYNPGPAPASEPETRAVMRLVEKYAPSKIVSVHQPFRCLNWDGEAGRILAGEMSAHNGYRVTADVGYPTPGSFGRYCARRGIAMVTLEMGLADAATCWRENREALLAAIRVDVKRPVGVEYARVVRRVE